MLFRSTWIVYFDFILQVHRQLKSAFFPHSPCWKMLTPFLFSLSVCLPPSFSTSLAHSVSSSLSISGAHSISLVNSHSSTLFGKATVTYLGKQVGRGQVRPVEEKVVAITSFPVPSTRREVRRFLGMAGRSEERRVG